MFLKIRDKVHKLLNDAGVFSMQEVISGCTGDSWKMLAYVVRLKELGEVKEVNYDKDVPAGQYRIFTSV